MSSETSAHTSAAPAAWVARLAWAVAALMLVVTCASAWLRLATPRPPCSDWPACRAAPVPEAVVPAGAPAPAAPDAGADARAAPDAGGLRAARLVHRVAATTVLLGTIVLVVALRRRPGGRAAWILLLLALALSALGIVTPGARAGAVLLGNLLGGLLMLAVAAWLALRLQPILHAHSPLDPAGAPANASQDASRDAPQGGSQSGPPQRARSARWLAALWLLQAALGALSGAALWRPAPPLHLALACALLPWAFALGLGAWREGLRRRGAALAALVVVQFALGVLAAAGHAAWPWVWLHNAGAAVGLALLFALQLGPRR